MISTNRTFPTHTQKLIVPIHVFMTLNKIKLHFTHQNRVLTHRMHIFRSRKPHGSFSFLGFLKGKQRLPVLCSGSFGMQGFVYFF